MKLGEAQGSVAGRVPQERRWAAGGSDARAGKGVGGGEAGGRPAAAVADQGQAVPSSDSGLPLEHGLLMAVLTDAYSGVQPSRVPTSRGRGGLDCGKLEALLKDMQARRG